jgi:hypothetical protein
VDSPNPEEAIAPSKSRPIGRSLVDSQLLSQGEILASELAVAAAQEREEFQAADADRGMSWVFLS